MKHLPECKSLDVMPEATKMFYSTSRRWFWEHRCICDQLRACEQRVLDAAREAVQEWISYTFPGHCPSWTAQIPAAIDALKETNVNTQ